jgi:cytochrome c biogenesis protein CcmG/thiol:disulfide interchange protein DsbE
MNRAWRISLIVLVFAGLLALLDIGLHHDPHRIPSPLIGKPAPGFVAPLLMPTSGDFSPRQLKGKVWLLNVWASWCTSCREEHPLLLSFAHGRHIALVGLDYKDDPVAARHWLAQAGDPYDLVASDGNGHIGIDYGVYGVPETYLIDGQGRIVYKQIGPLTTQVLQDKILPLIRSLSR